MASYKSYNRLNIPQKPTFVLRLVSYGHSNGPLTLEPTNEKARLSFSVRDVPSPPAQQRRKYTGLSPRMRKEVMANKAAGSRLEQMTEAIEEKMEELQDERSREPTPEPEAVLKGQEPPRELIVGIMCEEGKHRSVSFVEELSKNINRGKDWDIKVEHRDLGILDVDEVDDEEDDEEEGSDQEVVSPTAWTVPDRKRKISQDKFRKKIRSQSIQLDAGI